MSILGFEILSKLAQSPHSSVYKVRRISDSKIYALKKLPLAKLNPKQLENVVNEIRITASIKHPNAVAYKDSFYLEPDRSLCLVTEYSDSGDLYKKIKRHKKCSVQLEENFIWSVLIQITQALSALHGLGVFHCNIKSANVFLSKDGSVRLGDFGISKIFSDGLFKNCEGTPYYASPEVWGEESYSNKSDVWSLGCVVYEMMALKLPFRGKDMQELQNNVKKSSYKAITKGYSDEILQLMDKLLSNNPDFRPSCGEILMMEGVRSRINLKNMVESQSVLLEKISIPCELDFKYIALPKADYGKDDPIDGKRKRILPRLTLQGHASRIELHKTIENSVDRLKRIKDVYLSPRKQFLSPQFKTSRFEL